VVTGLIASVGETTAVGFISCSGVRAGSAPWSLAFSE
jgi:hypothetical protein